MGERDVGASDRPDPDRAPSLEVALATYESERFLPELLDSLFAQTEKFTLLVADDGSSDSTMDILEDYSERYPRRLHIIARERQPHGASGNFSRLIDRAQADYLLLCDHDDVWLPKKIFLSLAKMRALEEIHGTGVPLLVHTDLSIVDSDLELLGSSFFKYSKIDPSRNDLTSLLTANVATGCTIIMNRALYERARPIPPEAMMHDHWLALVAAALGAVAYVEEATILYRQHGTNLIGARSSGTASFVQRIRQTLFGAERQRLMRRYSRQASVLLRRYRDEMSGEMRRTTETFAEIWSVSRWRRFARLRGTGLGLSGIARNLALLIVVTRKGAEDRKR